MRVSLQTALRLKEAGFPQARRPGASYVLPTEFYYGDYSGDSSGMWPLLWAGNGTSELFKDNSCETLVSAPTVEELIKDLDEKVEIFRRPKGELFGYKYEDGWYVRGMGNRKLVEADTMADCLADIWLQRKSDKVI